VARPAPPQPRAATAPRRHSPAPPQPQAARAGFPATSGDG